MAAGEAGCEGPAAANLIGPALIWTVFTFTGLIGSDEPGMTAIGWVWMTPLVSGAGSQWAIEQALTIGPHDASTAPTPLTGTLTTAPGVSKRRRKAVSG